MKVETKVEGSAVSESGSTESKTESEGLLTIDETAQAQEQEGKQKRHRKMRRKRRGFFLFTSIHFDKTEAANTIIQHIANEDEHLKTQNDQGDPKFNRPMAMGTIYTMNGSFPAPESHSAFIAAAGSVITRLNVLLTYGGCMS